MSDERFNEIEKQCLLELARFAIESRLKPVKGPPEIESSSALSTKCGAFVTVHKSGQLRGCIGTFISDQPVTGTIEEMALAAAFNDPRFPPLRGEELPFIDLEISVLSPMREIEDIEEIVVGEHGIYIICEPNRGVLLPQVATEQNWDRDTFLEHTCIKAGLHRGAWQEERTKIFIFSAEVFGEVED